MVDRLAQRSLVGAHHVGAERSRSSRKGGALSMNFEFWCNFNIGIPYCKFSTILEVYSKMFPKIYDDL